MGRLQALSIPLWMIIKMNELDIENLSYEQKAEKLNEILNRLDNADTPIDKLAEDVKLGTKLIKALEKKLKTVELEVLDAFKELESDG